TILRRLFGRAGDTTAAPSNPSLGQAARQVKLGSGLTIAVPRLDFPDISGGPRSGGYSGDGSMGGGVSPFS
ncbi:EscC/YscC/HrcC family type III secretion system outer membrane ring protein, partial [Escherichia coli]